jgi:dienelactone hydrolase
MERLDRFGRMMQEFMVRKVRTVSEENRETILGMRSKKAAVEYQESICKSLRKTFGRKPPKTPLNARTVGTVERDAYTVEKIIFESRPNLPVTGNLYIPNGLDGPAPAVLGVCGHSGNGKAAEAYQSFSQGLARKGYVVFIFDPFSQGERLQYHDGKGGSRVGACTAEHNWMGRQQTLLGEWFGAWRAWDGVRALEYLADRPEVDPAQIGLTGNSGGGTMTSMILAGTGAWFGETPFSMAAPSCYITTWRCNVENELPADAEQQPPYALAAGMEMGDLLIPHAPKPLILLGQEHDYFDARGIEDTYERLRHFWGLLGAEDNLQLYIGPRPHGYHQENREAMYAFFGGCTGLDRSGEPELTIEPDETLWCTETGQVDEMNPSTVHDFTRERSQELAAKRGKVEGDDLKKAATKLLNLPKRPEDPPHYRVLRPISGREYPGNKTAAVYLLETDTQWEAQALVYKLEAKGARASRPIPGEGPATLWVPHMSSDEELREDALCKKLGKQDVPMFTCDYRGIGESIPNTCTHRQFETIYGSDYFYASYGEMFGEPALGWRVWDILRTLDFMAAYGYDRVHLAAKGWGAVPAALVALLDDRVRQVTLKNAPISWSDLAESEMQSWPLAVMLPGVLQSFDLPDVYRALGRKKLSLVQPLSAAFKSMRKDTALAKLKAAGLKPGILG